MGFVDKAASKNARVTALKSGGVGNNFWSDFTNVFCGFP